MSVANISYAQTQMVQDDPKASALQMSPYLALVMAFVSSAEAEEKVQAQAGESLKVQAKAIDEVEAEQQQMTEENGPSPGASQLEESSFMQEMISKTQALDAKSTSINMSVQTTVQMDITNSAAREEADLNEGSLINQALQGLVR